MNRNYTRDKGIKHSYGDRRVLKESYRHHIISECKRRHDLRPGYLGMCRRRK